MNGKVSQIDSDEDHGAKDRNCDEFVIGSHFENHNSVFFFLREVRELVIKL